MKTFIITIILMSAAVFSPGQLLNAQVSLTDVDGIWISTDNGQNVNGLGTSHVSWGITNGQQSGYIFAPASLVFPVNITIGSQFDLATFTHENFVVGLGSSVKGATLATNFSFLVDGQAVNISPVYNFIHNETPNQGAKCCDDIVTIVNNSPITESFIVGDYEYTLDIKGFRYDGQLLTSFETEENKTNASTLVAEVTRVQIPEPSTYLLLGSMLLMALFFSRRACKVK